MSQNEWVKRRVNISDYHQAIMELISKLPKGKYDHVYGIPRGGLIIATYIAYQTDMELMVEYGLHIPKEKVLVVDDLADTGITLEPFVEADYTTATLFRKCRSTVQPTFCVHNDISDNYWIVFPYETDDEEINREI